MTCKTRDFKFAKLKRKDGEEFAISARLYELQPSKDYWLVRFEAKHTTWDHFSFTMTIPKSIALTADFAEVLVKGAGLQQVESHLQSATSAGRPMTLVESIDGWVMV